MPGKRIDLAGAPVASGRIAAFIIGELFLSTDARHQDVSGAVYEGLLMVAAGLALVSSAGLGAPARCLRGKA